MLLIADRKVYVKVPVTFFKILSSEFTHQSMKFAEELSFYFFNEFLTLLNPMFSRSTCSAETNAIISSRESGTFFVNASN